VLIFIKISIIARVNFSTILTFLEHFVFYSKVLTYEDASILLFAMVEIENNFTSQQIGSQSVMV
jgi:hypothetical protein